MKLCMLLLTCLAAAAIAKGPNQLGNLPVTTTFAIADASGAVADIAVDNLGSYLTDIDGVTSFLTTNRYNGIVWGDSQIGTLNSTMRKVSLGFTSDSVFPIRIDLKPIRAGIRTEV